MNYSYDDFFNFASQHPFYFIAIIGGIFFLFILREGWWPAVAVYTDAKERNIPGRFGWTLLALFLNTYGLTFYSAYTKKPQTLVTFSPLGVAGGDKLEGISKTKRFILFICSITFIYSLNREGEDNKTCLTAI